MMFTTAPNCLSGRTAPRDRAPWQKGVKWGGLCLGKIPSVASRPSEGKRGAHIVHSFPYVLYYLAACIILM